MCTTPSEPLSLEDQCLLHLVCHLEEYLPETLASLPRHLRCRLLHNLPLVDACQLENTAVSAGIDMPDLTTNLRNQSNKWTCQTILNKQNTDFAKEHLFSAHYCLGVSNWKGIQQSFAPIGKGDGYFRYPTLHRHVRYFSEECQHIDLLSILVEKCQWMPLLLKVNLEEMWKGEKATTLVRKFLSGIQELELNCYGYVHGPKQGIFILEQVLSNPKPALNSLELHGLDSDATMAAVAMYFSPAIDSGDPVYSQPNIPYSGLISISIDLSVHCSLSETQSLYLQSVIHYQDALTSVTLVSRTFSSTPTISLLSAVASLFHQPQFKKLKLDRLQLTWEHLGILLPQFLSAPSEDNKKVLCLEGIMVPANCTPPEPLHITRNCSSLPQKALILILSRMPPEFYQWLSACNLTDLLSSLTVEGPMRGQTGCMQLLPTTTLQHLHFGRITLLPSPDKTFINLFQGPHLKSVHLYECAIGPDGLLPALTQGLRRQVSVGSLEDLNLEENRLDTSPESELQEFFDVLFTLPQLSNLRLNLKNNCLKPRHFSLMHGSWRMNAGQSGKRLKVLEVITHTHDWNGMSTSNAFQDNISDLNAVAQKTCHTGSSQQNKIDYSILY